MPGMRTSHSTTDSGVRSTTANASSPEEASCTSNPRLTSRRAEHSPDRHLVVDNERLQVGVCARGFRSGRRGGRFRSRLNGLRRERQPETRADVRRAQFQRAAVRRRNAVRNRQAQAGALPHIFRGEKRLEDAPGEIRANAGSVIPTLQPPERRPPNNCAT